MRTPTPTNTRPLCLLTLAATSLLAVQNTQAIGFRIVNQDAAAIARGNAFTATADTPAAMYYNPAGITQIEGTQAQLGFYITSVNSTYHSPAGGKAHSLFEVQPVPQMYLVHSPKESDLSFGLGTYAPYGLGIEWPEDSGFRTLALEGRLMYTTVNPVVAWQALPSLSIAAGPTLNYGRVELRQGIFLPTAGDEFKFKGTDFAYGYTVSARWQPTEKLAFGINYKSKSEMTFRGHSVAMPYTAEETTRATIPFPQYIMGGVSYRPTPDWNFEFNVDWTDWDSLNTVTFEKSSGNTPFAFNWQSSFLYEFGITRKLKDGYFASIGYFYSGNSTSAVNFNPLTPDTNLHVGSLGIGRQLEKWSWAVSYQIITGPKRTITGSTPSIGGQSADGTYKFFNHSLNIAVGYGF
ncbi:MAG TPA: outer membrane protein transport protein [Verrucomicrobiae bacterium]